MSVIRYDCADDVSDDEQWWEADDCSADQIHRRQPELRSIQTLAGTVAWSASVGQVNEQCDDNDDQNDIIY